MFSVCSLVINYVIGIRKADKFWNAVNDFNIHLWSYFTYITITIFIYLPNGYTSNIILPGFKIKLNYRDESRYDNNNNSK